MAIGLQRIGVTVTLETVDRVHKSHQIELRGKWTIRIQAHVSRHAYSMYSNNSRLCPPYAAISCPLVAVRHHLELSGAHGVEAKKSTQ